MATLVGSLLIALGLDSGDFKSGLSNAEKEFRRSTKRMENIGRGMANIGKNLSLAITAPLIALGVTSVKAAVESNQAIKSVEATLASMGAQAGFTAKQLELMASGIMRKSLYDDDEVLRKVTNTLLTFGNVTGDVFVRAQQAAVDLSAKFGKDLQGSTLMVGKALQNPVKGLTALTRAGISFSPAQAAVIKSLVETGRAAEAQDMILKELERQVLGSAEAMRNADPLAAMRLSFGEFQEEIGKKILPLLPRLVDAITKVLDAFGKLSPGMQETVLIAAGLAAAFGPLLIVMGSLVTAMSPMIAGLGAIGRVAIATAVQTGSLTAGLGVLRAAFASLAASLGPYAVALGLVGAALYIIISRSREGTGASAEYRAEQKKLIDVQAKLQGITLQLATATGKAREEAIKNAKAVRTETLQLIANARAALFAARAKWALAKIEAEAVEFSAANAMSGGSTMAVGGNFAAQRSNVAARQARTDADNQLKVLQGWQKRLEEADAIINSAQPPSIPTSDSAPISTGGPSRADRAKEQEDRTAEIQARFNNELYNYTQQNLSAMQQLATSAEERADLELRGIEWSRRQTLQEIAADEEYNEVQKAELSAAVERLAEYEREANALNLRRELDQQAMELADDAHRAQIDALQVQAELAGTDAERKRIALAIFDAEQAYLSSKLRSIELNEDLNDFERERARVTREALEASSGARRAAVSRANETELEGYLRELNKSPEQLGEELTGVAIDGLESLEDGLMDVLSGVKSVKEAFHDMAKSILQDLMRIAIRQLIIRSLANLFGGAVGGGGGVGAHSLGGGLSGFAMGTNYAPGGLAIVGERGPEIVNLRRGSQVIPNHELKGMGRSSMQLAFHNDFRGASPEAVAGINARLDQMQRELPGTIVSTMQDARSRFVWRD